MDTIPYVSFSVVEIKVEVEFLWSGSLSEPSTPKPLLILRVTHQEHQNASQV